jgi:pimeloyl-ACP methyl ester carboxylesterase
VIGCSLRGAVTQHLVALKPARVASLMLVTSACSGKKVALPLRLLAVPVLGCAMSRGRHRRASDA